MWILYKVYFDELGSGIQKKELINTFSSKEELEIVLKLLNKNNKNKFIGFTYQYIEPFS